MLLMMSRPTITDLEIPPETSPICTPFAIYLTPTNDPIFAEISLHYTINLKCRSLWAILRPVANPEHLALARRYAAGERGFRLEMLDLSGADLRNLDFSEAWLRDTDLSGANLRGCSFVGAP